MHIRTFDVEFIFICQRSRTSSKAKPCYDSYECSTHEIIITHVVTKCHTSVVH
ncbi:hypothetical protein HanRHA438_Chr17g0825781 [Helianthus annuus]|nr:hypothetical protein HanRHA438_Chr17g0825781 [Helianthus annuus]